MNDPLMDWANKSAKEQVAELLGHIAQMEKSGLENFDKRQALIGRVAELKVENQQLRRDAARYRKLRSADQSGAFIAVRSPNDVVAQMTGLYADECVDRTC